ncbi:hypothetical protein BDQ12DRAFT_679286 [Crucibulum laeve]|uniref:RING-type domain-containing protein n=1 Tax=Crucibulum laeve TaxID=68775 RepID=A0A5C3M9G8_9AGAR|nr:hypothetical protein BDQ12DRAFT_679286 [Crucibulum laeve]
MSDDEFGVIDDLADLQDVDWNAVLAGPSVGTEATREVEQREVDILPGLSPIRQSSPDTSNHYSVDGDMDAAFLEELDQLEMRITQVPQAGPSRLTEISNTLRERSPMRASGTPQSNDIDLVRAPRFFGDGEVRPPQPMTAHRKLNRNPSDKTGDDARVEKTSRASSKRPRSAFPSPEAYPYSPNKKGKTKANYSDDLHRVLAKYEDEMTCPICCDIFVATHIGNPCGHSFCGDCGWQWTQKSRLNGCPVCRAKLTKSMPMIPNIAMDNTVEKHIQALGLSGNEEWRTGGSKLKEWTSRKEKWKQDVTERAKAASRPKACNNSRAYVRVIDFDDIARFDFAEPWLVPPEEENYDYY